jgi:hypothetical protein
MTYFRLGVAAVLLALGGALTLDTTPVATADPHDRVPVCTGDQTPQDSGCRTVCPESAPLDSTTTGCTEPGTITVSGGPADQLPRAAGGTDPEIPFGVDPGNTFGRG